MFMKLHFSIPQTQKRFKTELIHQRRVETCQKNESEKNRLHHGFKWTQLCTRRCSLVATVLQWVPRLTPTRERVFSQAGSAPGQVFGEVVQINDAWPRSVRGAIRNVLLLLFRHSPSLFPLFGDAGRKAGLVSIWRACCLGITPTATENQIFLHLQKVLHTL